MISLNSKIVFTGILLAVAPLPTFAARLYLDTPSNTVSVGDTFVVSVRADSQHASINVVEGDISVSTSTALVTATQTDGSLFPLWPHVPVFDPDTGDITFTGGVPGGFNSSDALLFTITLVAKRVGVLTLNPTNLSAYVNDGKGTLAPVEATPLQITVQGTPGGNTAHTSSTTLVWSLGILILIFFLCGAYWWIRRSSRSKNNTPS